MTTLIIITICLIILIFCAIPTRASVSSAWLEQNFEPLKTVPASVRIATFNIHGGKGTDGKRDLGRITAAIGSADIVAIQEVRSGWRPNQARKVAHSLALGCLFVPTLRRWCTSYRGNGLLSRFAIRDFRTYPLPNITGHRYRVYSVAEMALGGQTLSILFTHLHTARGRQQQLQIVLEQFSKLPVPAILLGDLNTRPDDPILEQVLPADATDAIAMDPATGADLDRVDWILTRGLEVIGSGCSDPGASDHPFYWMEARFAEAAG